MAAFETKREMKNILMSGYEHYSRQEERFLIGKVLNGDLEGLDAFDADQFVLAAQPLRSTKNLLICLTAVTCRYAADIGADDTRCFVLSDFYINEIEKIADTNQALALVKDMLTNYHDLVQEGLGKNYTLPILRTIRYLYKHIYEPCSLKRLAQEVNLHPTYLSYLFKQEVGVNFNTYVRNQKMEEARKLLLNTDHSISEIAEMLGYDSLSYFSKVFTAYYKTNPHKYAASRQVSN